MLTSKKRCPRSMKSPTAGRPRWYPYDELATRLGTTLTMTKTLATLLRARGFAVLTFGGIALTGLGLRSAQTEQKQA